VMLIGFGIKFLCEASTGLPPIHAAL